MIICAAIQFQMQKTGQVATLCGLRHGDIFSQMADMGLHPGKDYVEVCQGFINHKGEFLDRYAALTHALEVGQLSATTREWKKTHDEDELFSEDLY